jgi:hypothetical protein
MSGTNQSKVVVTLRNPLDHNDLLDYYIVPNNSKIGQDWVAALTKLLQSKNLLEKNYCFMGFPQTARNLEYLSQQLNDSIRQINLFSMSGVWELAGLPQYVIEEYFTPDVIRYGTEYLTNTKTDPSKKEKLSLGLSIKHAVMNTLHNHFERLQGTVWELSTYYKLADYETKYAIRQLNNLCHEIETLVLSQQKDALVPEWIRPSQITTFLHADRSELTDDHRAEFIKNGYDRRMGHVYMHWSQIGKTLFEVWRDENAPKLVVGDDPTDISIVGITTCEAINSLKFYSGEFDIEWGKDIIYGVAYPWYNEEQDQFKQWLIDNKIDPTNPKLSLGYLPVGEVDLIASFGTTDNFAIWDLLSTHLDICKIEINGTNNEYSYCWSDKDYKQQQINMMKPGYDFSSRR